MSVMKTAIALLALVLAAPASACSGTPREPPDLSGDETRARAVAERLRSAQERREAVRREAWMRLEQDPAYRALEERRRAAAYRSPDYEAASEAMRALAQSRVWSAVRAADPVEVQEHAYLCGSRRLADGHEINAGSSWSVRNEDRPELGWVEVDGPEVHYLMEHGRATRELLETLERLLAAPPAASAPRAVAPGLSRAALRLEGLRAPAWD